MSSLVAFGVTSHSIFTSQLGETPLSISRQRLEFSICSQESKSELRASCTSDLQTSSIARQQSQKVCPIKNLVSSSKSSAWKYCRIRTIIENLCPMSGRGFVFSNPTLAAPWRITICIFSKPISTGSGSNRPARHSTSWESFSWQLKKGKETPRTLIFRQGLRLHVHNFMGQTQRLQYVQTPGSVPGFATACTSQLPWSNSLWWLDLWGSNILRPSQISPQIGALEPHCCFQMFEIKIKNVSNNGSEGGLQPFLCNLTAGLLVFLSVQLCKHQQFLFASL